jgi:hypothetical protein
MTTATIDGEVQAYLAAVAAHLGDLPDTEREELIEDLREHLQEVAAEGEGSLAERLGPASEYAEEFRASAGLPVREGDAPAFVQRVAVRLSRAWPGRVARGFLNAGPVRSVLAFLPQLRPGWWVLRGYLVVLLFDVLAGYHYYGDVDDLLVPHIQGSQVWTFIAIGVAIWASVALGRRSDAGRARHLSLALNAAAVGLGVLAFAQLGQPSVYMQDYYQSGSEMVPYLHHQDGVAISNICPYGPDGKLLAGVLLFDQGGRAIENTAELRYEYAPGLGQNPPVAVIKNAYPQPQQFVDRATGQAAPFRCPEVLLPGSQPSVPGVTPTPIPAPGAGD